MRLIGRSAGRVERDAGRRRRTELALAALPLGTRKRFRGIGAGSEHSYASQRISGLPKQFSVFFNPPVRSSQRPLVVFQAQEMRTKNLVIWIFEYEDQSSLGRCGWPFALPSKL